MIRCLLLMVSLLLLVACGGPELPPAAQPSAKCPPPGTEVPIGQMMNPSFAPDFVGCHVKAKALFWSPTAVGVLIRDPNVVGFQVTPPTTTASQGTYYTVKISKALSAPLFTFKQGDPVVLTGGIEPQPADMARFANLSIAHAVIFVADSIEAGAPQS